mmetsp:Transcript_37113/g.104756  ORF Transcript_37113/g.104756 Transcript_37113/m.104756 type:complete len:340 (+) Transcript_37113:3943-4962(+)
MPPANLLRLALGLSMALGQPSGSLRTPSTPAFPRLQPLRQEKAHLGAQACLQSRSQTASAPLHSSFVWAAAMARRRSRLRRCRRRSTGWRLPLGRTASGWWRRRNTALPAGRWWCCCTASWVAPTTGRPSWAPSAAESAALQLTSLATGTPLRRCRMAAPSAQQTAGISSSSCVPSGEGPLFPPSSPPLSSQPSQMPLHSSSPSWPPPLATAMATAGATGRWWWATPRAPVWHFCWLPGTLICCLGRWWSAVPLALWARASEPNGQHEMRTWPPACCPAAQAHSWTTGTVCHFSLGCAGERSSTGSLTGGGAVQGRRRLALRPPSLQGAAAASRRCGAT